MPARDLARDLNERLVLESEVGKHLIANDRVLFHSLEFFVGQFSWLVQDLFRNGYFADIVERRCFYDKVALGVGKVVSIILLAYLVQQYLGERADVDDMHATFAVTEFKDVAQDRDHQAAVALFFEDLIGDHIRELALLSVELDGVAHPSDDDELVERSIDEIGNAEAVGALDEFRRAFGRDGDHRKELDPAVLIHGFQDTETIDLRHDHIQDNDRYLGGMLLQDGDSLFTIFCFDDVVGIRKDIGKQHSIHR